MHFIYKLKGAGRMIENFVCRTSINAYLVYHDIFIDAVKVFFMLLCVSIGDWPQGKRSNEIENGLGIHTRNQWEKIMIFKIRIKKKIRHGKETHILISNDQIALVDYYRSNYLKQGWILQENVHLVRTVFGKRYKAVLRLTKWITSIFTSQKRNGYILFQYVLKCFWFTAYLRGESNVS